MKNVIDRMKENQSEKKIADFRVKQQQPYWFKMQYAAIRARERTMTDQGLIQALRCCVSSQMMRGKMARRGRKREKDTRM